MLELAELQGLMVRGLTDPARAVPRALFQGGDRGIRHGLRVHANTVAGALTGALAQTYPTVRVLVGDVFFDKAASAYAEARPPCEARLAAFTTGFAAFIACWPPAGELAYLGDVARLELAIRECAAAPVLDRLVSIDPSVALSLPISIRAIELDHPADLIHAALHAGNDHALAAIDLRPSPRWLAAWRSGNGAAYRRLAGPAGRFLSAILAGRDAEAAWVSAAEDDLYGAAVAIQTEVFGAPFATVIPTTVPEPMS